jgi:hypothetical protein
VFTFNAVDYPLTNVFRIEDVIHCDIIRIGQQEVGARQIESIFVSQPVDELIDSTGSVGLGVGVSVLAKNRDCFSIEDKLDVSVSRPCGWREACRDGSASPRRNWRN